jgi:hypothetical protein
MRKVGVFMVKFFMEAKVGGNDICGWGMSRASKRAKEHEKRTWEVKVMAKTELLVG